MDKRRVLILFAILIIAIFVNVFFLRPYLRFLQTPLSQTKNITLLLTQGSSVHRLLASLQAQGYLKQHPNFFLLLAYIKGATDKLKPGEYSFDPGSTPGQLLEQILAGKVVLHRFTLVEGWTFQQMMTALNALPTIKHTLCGVSSAKLLTQLGFTAQNPEGLFFPATYYFSLNTKDSDLLKWAYRLREKKLQAAWKTRAADLPYQIPYQALIVASLVEKETAIAKERPMVAGVILRRLKIGVPLQIDSTVIYGLGAHYQAKLTSEDLRKDTPYNTYTRRGLPPTPIDNPSLASIVASLHPDHSHNLYFVARGDGTHQFSADLAAHNIAVQRYQIDKYPYIKKTNCPPWYLSKTLGALFN